MRQFQESTGAHQNHWVWRVGEKKGSGQSVASRLTDERKKERNMTSHSHSSKDQILFLLMYLYY